MNSGKKALGVFLVCSLIVALPYYIFSYTASGNPFFSISTHIGKLDEIGGENNPVTYVLSRISEVALLPIKVVTTREYTTPLLLLFFPLVIFYRKKIIKEKLVLSITLFTISQWLIWWFVPPLSVRYSLAGFITGVILTIHLLTIFWKERSYSKNYLFAGLLLCGILFLPVRLLIAKRSLQYLSGNQTRIEYLVQFLDGNIDSVLTKWHGL